MTDFQGILTPTSYMRGNVMAQAAEPYPVVLTGNLDEPLSRWLWLVKWVLIIPHVIILLFLFIAVVVATVIAFFAILFTGKYPRGLFDFNVGVMRWSWRVGFYSYQALGTDKYPPFTLKSTDYPADLTVEYPQRLHRGLPLIKWLLALPHYLVVSILQGGEGYGGLNGLLVLFAGVVLLFKGSYHPDIFKLVMGINRWGYRVTGYVVLMTDRYPPFRLEE